MRVINVDMQKVSKPHTLTANSQRIKGDHFQLYHFAIICIYLQLNLKLKSIEANSEIKNVSLVNFLTAQNLI